MLLTKKGAHVSIVARDKGKLEKAIEELEVSSDSIDRSAVDNQDTRRFDRPQNKS